MHILYLGSKSPSRRMLLDMAKIPYAVVGQDADETKCDWSLPLQKVVESIAQYKMEHVILPAGYERDEQCFVLTADTLSEDAKGIISGKPSSRDDAISKIKTARNGMTTGTAFCIERRSWQKKAWVSERRILRYVQAKYEFIVPDESIEEYLDNTGMQGTQAIAVEAYGAQFLKSVQGSYSTIVGLPLFEVRQALEELGFFK